MGVNSLGENAQLDQLLGLIESMAATRFVESPQARSGKPTVIAHAAPDVGQLRIGYVGLGTMGGAIARRMMLARKLRVFDARPEIVRAFAAEGAEGSADLCSLARVCDVIFVCLPTSAVVRDVIFGKDGLAQGLSGGKIIVDQTTGDPSVTRRIAADLGQLGVALVDAPVTGGPRGAVAGTITIMAGGPAQAFETVRPVLESVSPNIVYFGPSGSGHIAKLISNAVSTCNVLLTYEAASIAVRCGLKLADVAKVINSGGGWSAATERILPTLSQGKATADFQMQLMVKDLKLVGRLAIECGAPIMVARTVCGLYETGLQRFGGSANIDTMGQLFESMSGVSFGGA
jgi:3-hydroxyisobutyrate dehydrogenase